MGKEFDEVADQADVRRIALSLPDTAEADNRFAFSVLNKGKHKGFVWVWFERVEPRKPRVPRPEVIAVRVANQGEKASLIAADPAKYFTEPHYNGFPAYRTADRHREGRMRELIVDAWRCQAPPALVKAAGI